jgi:hypothetical protein
MTDSIRLIKRELRARVVARDDQYLTELLRRANVRVLCEPQCVTVLAGIPTTHMDIDSCGCPNQSTRRVEWHTVAMASDRTLRGAVRNLLAAHLGVVRHCSMQVPHIEFHSARGVA